MTLGATLEILDKNDGRDGNRTQQAQSRTPSAGASVNRDNRRAEGLRR